MDIVIDFDGTCVTHDFPEIGKSIGAEPVLRDLVSAGHNLILFTMRSNNGDLPLFTPNGIENVSGNFLDDAVNWFKENKIELYGIQKNPTQQNWTSSPKAYGQIIIDDAALGCPLDFDVSISKRPYVDWDTVYKKLEDLGLFKK